MPGAGGDLQAKGDTFLRKSSRYAISIRDDSRKVLQGRSTMHGHHFLGPKSLLEGSDLPTRPRALPLPDQSRPLSSPSVQRAPEGKHCLSPFPPSFRRLGFSHGPSPCLLHQPETSEGPMSSTSWRASQAEDTLSSLGVFPK